uniref:Uncharacterized protein n=1 Tax=Tetradesmus obliquus TaxID=3088 RepID=A0A383VZE3_TETOB
MDSLAVIDRDRCSSSCKACKAGSQQQQFCDRFQIRGPTQIVQHSTTYSFTPLETQRTLSKHPRCWFPGIHSQHATSQPRSSAPMGTASRTAAAR